MERQWDALWDSLRVGLWETLRVGLWVTMRGRGRHRGAEGDRGPRRVAYFSPWDARSVWFVQHVKENQIGVNG